MLRINGKDPRKESYIQESLNSLIDNGWGAPLIYNDTDMRGDFWGFLQVGRLLLAAYPLADGYVILQDDVVACMSLEDRQIRNIPFTNFDLVSLFTLHHNLNGATGETYRMPGRQVGLCEMKIETKKERITNCNGGIAYYISKSWLQGILELAHKAYTPTPLCLGEICNNFHSLYLVSPINIFQHIGKESSLHPDKPYYRWDVSEASPYRK